MPYQQFATNQTRGGFSKSASFNITAAEFVGDGFNWQWTPATFAQTLAIPDRGLLMPPGNHLIGAQFDVLLRGPNNGSPIVALPADPGITPSFVAIYEDDTVSFLGRGIGIMPSAAPPSAVSVNWNTSVSFNGPVLLARRAILTLRLDLKLPVANGYDMTQWSFRAARAWSVISY